ncbi:MAG: hypothetical protein HRT68_09620 [Flavobacteriaceae bacterium]|nr:hypothetical protein [Flavobacteriaceae bacterium]
MTQNKKDILNLDWITRLKLINSISGIKPANLFVTSNNGGANLAIFSSSVHLGNHPSKLSFIAKQSNHLTDDTFKIF